MRWNVHLAVRGPSGTDRQFLGAYLQHELPEALRSAFRRALEVGGGIQVVRDLAMLGFAQRRSI